MLGFVTSIWILQLMIYLKLSKICDLLDKHTEEVRKNHE